MDSLLIPFFIFYYGIVSFSFLSIIRITKKIGEGSYGEVFLKKDGEEFNAVKVNGNYFLKLLESLSNLLIKIK